MSEQLILGSVFVAVLLISFVVTNYFTSRREIARNIENVRSARDKSEDKINKILGNSNPQIRYYLDVVQNDPPNSLRMRLVQAGYFSRSAQVKFNLIRLVADHLREVFKNFRKVATGTKVIVH